MHVLTTLIAIAQVVSALALIFLVLLQHGKGADMGAAFGSGASGSLFGATGSANFMSRTTGVLAAIFFVCTLALAYFATSKSKDNLGVMESVPAQTVPAAPAKPATPAAGSEVPGVLNAVPAPVTPAPAQK